MREMRSIEKQQVLSDHPRSGRIRGPGEERQRICEINEAVPN